MYKIVDSWLNTRKTQTSELLHKNCLIYFLIFLMKYINISQNWLNFFHLISNFLWFPTFHILSVFANFFRIKIFWSIYFHKFHVSYIHTNCLFSATFWTRTGSKSLILTVFKKWFCIHFLLLDHLWLEIFLNICLGSQKCTECPVFGDNYCKKLADFGINTF